MDAPAPPPEHSLPTLPDDCLNVILRCLPLADRFRAARVFRKMRQVFVARPIKGMPVLEVDSVVSKSLGHSRQYTIRYVGLAEVDILNSARPRDAAKLLERFQTHFIVLFTFNHPFLSAWTAAHGAARLDALAAKRAAAANAQEAGGAKDAEDAEGAKDAGDAEDG